MRHENMKRTVGGKTAKNKHWLGTKACYSNLVVPFT